MTRAAVAPSWNIQRNTTLSASTVRADHRGGTDAGGTQRRRSFVLRLDEVCWLYRRPKQNCVYCATLLPRWWGWTQRYGESCEGRPKRKRLFFGHALLSPFASRRSFDLFRTCALVRDEVDRFWIELLCSDLHSSKQQPNFTPYPPLYHPRTTAPPRPLPN